MRKLTTAVLAVTLFVAALMPRATHATTIVAVAVPIGARAAQVYWYGCYRTTNGAHFTGGLDHRCREYPIRRAHTRLTGYTKHCRQTAIRIEVYCVRFPTFYVPPPPQPPVSNWPTVQRWSQYIYAASARTGIPARVIAAMITVESGGHPDVSSQGYGSLDLGLLQYGASEARIVSGYYGYDPRLNILTGSLYLAWIERFCAAGDLRTAVAMYNGGCGSPQYSYAARVFQYV